MGCSQSGAEDLQCSIFAENIPNPVKTILSVTIENYKKDLVASEIEELSESLKCADIELDTGRIA